MDSVGKLNAEFESVGEAIVAERLNANVYKDEARVLAMRWLNEKSLARAGVDASARAPLVDPSARRLARAEQSSRIAILCAVAALLAAVGSLALSVQTLQTVQALNRVAAFASQPPGSKP